MKKIIGLIAVVFCVCLSGCNSNGRYELHNDGKIKLDTKTGKVWYLSDGDEWTIKKYGELYWDEIDSDNKKK